MLKDLSVDQKKVYKNNTKTLRAIFFMELHKNLQKAEGQMNEIMHIFS